MCLYSEVILINRGWVSRKQVKPETRSSGQIETEVELTGVVRMGESRPQFSPDHKGGIFLYRYAVHSSNKVIMHFLFIYIF